MKKTLQLLIFTLIIGVSFGQEKGDTSNKWGIGMAGSLNYTRFDYVKSYSDKHIDNIFILTPGVHLFGKRRISKHFSFEFGANYYNIKNKKIVTDSFTKERYRTSFTLFGVPTQVSYNFEKKRLNFSLTGGFEFSILTKNRKIVDYLILPGYPDPVTKEYNFYTNGQFALNANIGIQLNYEINKNIIAFTQLQYNKQLIPFIYEEEISTGGVYTYKTIADFLRLPMGIIYKL